MLLIAFTHPSPFPLTSQGVQPQISAAMYRMSDQHGAVGKGYPTTTPCASAVGILAAMCAKFRGAARIIIIDNVPFRLDFAQSKVPGLEVIDFSKHDTVKRLRELVPEGPHVSIEAVGFHYTKSLASTVEMAIGAQTDPSDMLNEMIVATRKVSRTWLRCSLR